MRCFLRCRARSPAPPFVRVGPVERALARVRVRVQPPRASLQPPCGLLAADSLPYCARSLAQLVACAPPTVWPQPSKLSLGGGGDGACLLFSAQLGLARAAQGSESGVLVRAMARYNATKLDAARTCRGAGAAGGLVGACVAVSPVVVSVADASEALDGDTDESYSLHLEAAGAANGGGSAIVAKTTFGAIRALETLAQLIECGAGGAMVVNATSVDVVDTPYLAHRALMIDTGRAFYPVEYIEAIVDAMAYAKLNVLHWHLVDDESFAFGSARQPALAEGAFHQGAVYSMQDLEGLVAFAKDRGVRIVPEIDMPGHARSWGVGRPDMLVRDCPSSSDPPMDVANASIFETVKDVLRDVVDVFPDASIHIGGDEVKTDCWDESPSTQAFIKAQGLTDGAALQSYFERQVVEFVASELNRSAVVWEEAFVHWDASKGALPASVVVEPWRLRGTNRSVVAQSLKAGHRTVYTTPDLYLDYHLPRAPEPAPPLGNQLGADWRGVYQVDPFPADDQYIKALTPAQQANFVGAEVVRLYPALARICPSLPAPRSVPWCVMLPC